MLGSWNGEVDGDEVDVVGERATPKRKYELMCEGCDEGGITLDREGPGGLQIQEQLRSIGAHTDRHQCRQDRPIRAAVRVLDRPWGSPRPSAVSRGPGFRR